jgi:hypothetical protein
MCVEHIYLMFVSLMSFHQVLCVTGQFHYFEFIWDSHIAVVAVVMPCNQIQVY